MSRNSLDGTKYMLGIVESHLERSERYLAHLATCTEFDVDVVVDYTKGKDKYGNVGFGKREPVTKTFTTRPSDTHVYKWHDGTEETCPGLRVERSAYCGGDKVLLFDAEVVSARKETERRIKSIKEDIAFLNQKIAEFVEQ